MVNAHQKPGAKEFLTLSSPAPANRWALTSGRGVSKDEDCIRGFGCASSAHREGAIGRPCYEPVSGCSHRTGDRPAQPAQLRRLFAAGLGSFPKAVHQLAGLHVQAVRESEDRAQSWLPGATLHAPDGSHVNAGGLGKSALGNFLAVAQLAQALAEG